MGIYGRKSENTFELPPAKNLQAVCIGIFDIGRQKNEYQGVVTFPYKLIIMFELKALQTQGERVGQRFQISEFYTNSTSENSNIRRDVGHWVGKEFTDAEFEAFDLETLIGQNCQIQIVHKEKASGGVKARIGSIAQSVEDIAPISPNTVFDRPPEWVQKFIDNQYKEPEKPQPKEIIADDFNATVKQAATGEYGQASPF